MIPNPYESPLWEPEQSSAPGEPWSSAALKDHLAGWPIRLVVIATGFVFAESLPDWIVAGPLFETIFGVLGLSLIALHVGRAAYLRLHD